MSQFILLSSEQMRASEEAAISAGVASAALMEAAGKGAADIILKAWSQRPVVVLCGPGNNGGDGFVVARRLEEAGWPVKIASVLKAEELKGDAKLMAGLVNARIEPLSPALFEGAGLVVDALFGTGLSRNIEGELGALIKALNASRLPVVAIDIPSGIHADTGAVMGAAIAAARTVTFFQKKPGHVLMPGRLHSGAVDVADIGITPEHVKDIKIDTLENHPAIWARGFRRPNPAGHKYHRGSVFVVSGPAHKTGAARLAAKGALRAGAGLVTVLSPPEAVSANAAHLTSIMLSPIGEENDIQEALKANENYKRVALVGPGNGAGEETRKNTKSVLAASTSAVLDADALTSFENDAKALFDLLRTEDILTPHTGEFARLFSDIDPASSKLEAAREASKRAGAVVLLKGPDTVIAAPDGRAAVNVNAPPYLAIAGAGDVLAGIVAGFAAQGMAAFEAACAGVWFHGACGQMAGPGLIAEDLADQIPLVLKSLFAPPQGTKNTQKES